MARVTPETRFPMPRAAMRSRDVTRSCCNLFIDIWINHQSSRQAETAKDMAPKTRSSAEGKRKRDEKAKEEPKTEKADHDQTKVEDEQQNDELNTEETKGEDVKEEAQEEVKEEGTHIDLGSNGQLIPRTPNQSPQDLLTSGLAPL
jgi:hypothetical protein